MKTIEQIAKIAQEAETMTQEQLGEMELELAQAHNAERRVLDDKVGIMMRDRADISECIKAVGEVNALTKTYKDAVAHIKAVKNAKYPVEKISLAQALYEGEIEARRYER